LILGGAALQRCGDCIVLNAALAAEVTALAQKRLFPRLRPFFGGAEAAQLTAKKIVPDSNLSLGRWLQFPT
jgi:hypothetical protein